jgi:hypothetical protein
MTKPDYDTPENQAERIRFAAEKLGIKVTVEVKYMECGFDCFALDFGKIGCDMPDFPSALIQLVNAAFTFKAET